MLPHIVTCIFFDNYQYFTTLCYLLMIHVTNYNFISYFWNMSFFKRTKIIIDMKCKEIIQ